DERRVEGGEVASPPVVGVLERRPVCVRDEHREEQALDERCRPPRVAPLRGGEARAAKLCRHSNRHDVSSFLRSPRASIVTGREGRKVEAYRPPRDPPDRLPSFFPCSGGALWSIGI